MADNDNTSPEVKPEAPAEINSQETLEAALAEEPVNAEAKPEGEPETNPEAPKLEKKDSELIFGKYKSLEAAQEAFGSIQARATKAEQAYKELKKQVEGKTKDELKAMDYDGQLAYITDAIQDYKTFKEELLGKLEAEQGIDSAKSDADSIDSFVSKHPLLAETGLDEEFKLIATHPAMQEYTLDSIYEVRIKPKLERLMGTKITTKERKLVGTTAKPEPNKFADVSKMTPSEYEKHRKSILAEAGIK